MTYNLKPVAREVEDPVTAPAADGDGQDDAQTPPAASGSPEVN
jgi:hypothetical protein